jgi:hypothetical protein
MWIKVIQYRRKRQRLNLSRGTGLILIFVFLTALFTVLVHHHGDLYSNQVCAVCVTGPDTGAEAEHSKQEIEEQLLSFLNLYSDSDSKTGPVISTHTIRAPPLS